MTAMATPDGSLLKLPLQSSPEAFAAALGRSDAEAAVACALAVVADAKGLRHAPLALLAQHAQVSTHSIMRPPQHRIPPDTSVFQYPACMQACLEAMAPAGLGPEGTAASSLWKAAELVVQAVCSIPGPLRPALADAVLLQPFKQVRCLHTCFVSRVWHRAAGKTVPHAACRPLCMQHALWPL